MVFDLLGGVVERSFGNHFYDIENTYVICQPIDDCRSIAFGGFYRAVDPEAPGIGNIIFRKP